MYLMCFSFIRFVLKQVCILLKNPIKLPFIWSSFLKSTKYLLGFKCYICGSVYGKNSKLGCYTKDQYLVLKTLLALSKLSTFNEDDKFSLNLQEFTKFVKEQSIEKVKKRVKITNIKSLDEEIKKEMLYNYLNDYLVVNLKHPYNFQVFSNLLSLPEIKFCNYTLTGKEQNNYEEMKNLEVIKNKNLADLYRKI